MKPKQLTVTILLFFIALTGFTQPKRVSERIMAHDTSLIYFKRPETGKYIVAAAIAKPTLVYYLIDRYGAARDSTRMRPGDYKLLTRYQYDVFAYYPAAINLRRGYRKEVIDELRTYKCVRPASPYYHAVAYDHPELIRPDSITLLKGILRLQRENMRDSIYLWGYNIDDPKRIKPGQKATTAIPVSNKSGSLRIFINPDRFSSLYSAEVDTQAQKVSYYGRMHKYIASLSLDASTAANSSPAALFEYYLRNLEKARQLADEQLNRLKNNPVQYASLDDNKVNGLAAALAEKHAVDLSIDVVTNPDIERLSTDLKETYSHAAVNIRWLKFLGITYDTTPPSWDSVGTKRYELDNHLGNVLVTITDKRLQDNSGDTPVFYADPASSQDYYPFGMIMPESQWLSGSDSSYRYGFNGKENDNTVKGLGNQQDYGKRIYDPRVGRFLSVDPLQIKYPQLTPYQFASNNPATFIDLDGLEKAKPGNQESNFAIYTRSVDKNANRVLEKLEAKLNNMSDEEINAFINKSIGTALNHPGKTLTKIDKELSNQAREAFDDGLSLLYYKATGQNEKAIELAGQMTVKYGPLLVAPEEEGAAEFSQSKVYSIPKRESEAPIFDWEELKNNARMSDNPLSISISSDGKVFRAVIQNIESEYGDNIWTVMSDFLKKAKESGASRIEVKGIEIVNDQMNKIFQKLNGKTLMGYDVKYTRNGSYGEVDLVKDIPQK